MPTVPKYAAILVAVLALLSPPVAAVASVGQPSGTVEARFADADLVCVCKVTRSIQAGGTISPNDNLGQTEYLILAKVTKSYKGLPPAEEIQIDFRDRNAMEGDPLAVGIAYTLFLRKVSESRYQLLPVGGAAMKTLEAQLSMGRGQGPDGLQQEAIYSLAHSGDLADQMESLDLLSQYKSLSPSAVAALDQVSSGNLGDAALLSTAVLFSGSGEPSKYRSRLLAMLPAYEAGTNTSSGLMSDKLSEIPSIVASDSNAEDLGNLETLADSRLSAIRVAAMIAIRGQGSPEAVPFLVGKLDSSDPQVAYEAVITLAEVTHQDAEMAPGMGPFLKNRLKYTELWKAWFQSQRR